MTTTQSQDYELTMATIEASFDTWTKEDQVAFINHLRATFGFAPLTLEELQACGGFTPEEKQIAIAMAETNGDRHTLRN